MSPIPLLVFAAVLAVPSLTRAEEEPDEAEKETTGADAGGDEVFGHKGQWGLRAGLVGGMHVIFRYDEGTGDRGLPSGSPYCAEPDFTEDPDEQRNNCGFVPPLATEIALSFAPLDSVEPYLFTRLGFAREKDTDTKPLVLLGVGTRLYTMSDSAFKIFIEPGIAWEIEGGGDDPEWSYNGAFDPQYNKDVVFHLGIGPQYDFSKNIGAYLNASVDVGILRAIHAFMLLNLGVQARLP